MYYPAMLDIRGRLIAVIGGGRVALRKVKGLMDYGPHIRVISPEFDEGFIGLEAKLELVRARYSENMICDAFMVFAATSSGKVNREIREYCRDNRILCNIADDSAGSDFINPSGLRRGDLVISVSTSGKSPALAARIRRELEKRYTQECGDYLKLLGDVRKQVIDNCDDAALRRKILNELSGLDFEELKKRRNEYEGGRWIKGQ